MDFSRPIYWHEGMLLQPQHFQQQDRYHESLVHQLCRRINPYYWGVVQLEINPDSLQNMILELESCEMILSDGAFLRFHGNTELESRSFEDKVPAAGQPLEVFLGLRRLKEGEANVTIPGQAEAPGPESGPRYRVKPAGGDTFDLFAAESSARIDFLYYDPKVLFGPEKETAGEYQLFKLAEVRRTERGFELSPRYIPPATSLAASPLLVGLVKKVRDRMTTKARELLEFKRERGIQTREIAGRDTLFLFFALTVNRYTPLLHQLSENPDAAHPWPVYGLLRSLIGELSAFSESVNFLGAAGETGLGALKPYDHEDLWNCFNPAVDLIGPLLDQLIARAGYSVKLTWDGQHYSAQLDEQAFAEGNRYYLIMSSPVPVRDLLTMVKNVAKIGSKSGVYTLVQRSLPGVPAEYLPAPPPELPQRTHSHHFLLDTSSRLWSMIEKDKSLSISFENKEVAGMEIEFTVLARER